MMLKHFHAIFKKRKEKPVWVKLTSGDWPLDPLSCFEFFFQDLPEDICWGKGFFPYVLLAWWTTSTGFSVVVTNSYHEEATFLHAPLFFSFVISFLFSIGVELISFVLVLGLQELDSVIHRRISILLVVFSHIGSSVFSRLPVLFSRTFWII